MGNRVEPGIDVRTEILVKMNDAVLGMPISAIFDMDIETGEWISLDRIEKRISVVGFRNSFFEVEKIFITDSMLVS